VTHRRVVSRNDPARLKRGEYGSLDNGSALSGDRRSAVRVTHLPLHREAGCRNSRDGGDHRGHSRGRDDVPEAGIHHSAHLCPGRVCAAVRRGRIAHRSRLSGGSGLLHRRRVLRYEGRHPGQRAHRTGRQRARSGTRADHGFCRWRGDGSGRRQPGSGRHRLSVHLLRGMGGRRQRHRHQRLCHGCELHRPFRPCRRWDLHQVSRCRGRSGGQGRARHSGGRSPQSRHHRRQCRRQCR